MSSSTSETESLLQNYREYIDGLTYAYPLSTQEMERFLSRFEQEFGARPSSPAAPYAYDAANVLLHVLEAGHREPEQIRDALLSLDGFDGVTASGLTFDKTGRVQWPTESFVIKRVRSGRPEIVD